MWWDSERFVNKTCGFYRKKYHLGIFINEPLKEFMIEIAIF